MSTQIAENDPENLRYSVSSGPNTPHFASLPEFAKRWFVYGKGGELWEREEDAPSGLRSYIQEMGMVLPWFGATGWAATGVGADATMRVTRRHTWGAAPFYVEAWRRGGFFFEPGEESTRWGGLLASKAGVRREKPENPWICAPLSAYRPRTVPPPDAAGAFESYLHMADFRDWKFSEWLIYLSHVRFVGVRSATLATYRPAVTPAPTTLPSPPLTCPCTHSQTSHHPLHIPSTPLRPSPLADHATRVCVRTRMVPLQHPHPQSPCHCTSHSRLQERALPPGAGYA